MRHARRPAHRARRLSPPADGGRGGGLTGGSPDRDGKALAFAALIVAGIGWGLGFPLGKLALREITPAHMVLWRFVVASLVAAPFAFRDRAARALFRSPPVIAAGLLYAIAFLMQFEGLAYVTVSLAALLVGLTPALVAVAAWLLGERVSRASAVGVIAATLGAALLAGKPEGAGTPFGIALSLLSLLVFLGWLLALKRAPTAADPLAMPAVTLLIGTAAIVPIALLLHGAPPLRLSAAAWAGIAGQGLIATFLATAAWAYGAARIDSATAGVFINIEPLLGAVLGITLFGDRASATLLLGGALIVGGSVIVVLGERSTAAGPEAAVRP